MKFMAARAALAGLCLFESVTAFAGAGWTGFAPVAELTPTTHHRYLARIKVSDNPSGCRDEQFFYQDYAAPGSRHMFRTLLAAVESGKNVRVYVTGKCDLDGYSEISSVSIVP